MGSWNTDPFDNDTAADFASTLDGTHQDDREDLVKATLTRTIENRDYLEGPEGEEAVAAAALVAAQCPGGESVGTRYGPDEALPTFTDGLRPLAVEALDRVVADDSELPELWDEAPGGPQWRQSISHMRAALTPE